MPERALIDYRLYYERQITEYQHLKSLTEDVDAFWHMMLFKKTKLDPWSSRVGGSVVFSSLIHHIDCSRTSIENITKLWEQQYNFVINDADEMERMRHSVLTLMYKLNDRQRDELALFILGRPHSSSSIRNIVISCINVNHLLESCSSRLVFENVCLATNNVKQLQYSLHRDHGSDVPLGDIDDYTKYVDQHRDDDDGDEDEWEDEDDDVASLDSHLLVVADNAAAFGNVDVFKYLMTLGMVVQDRVHDDGDGDDMAGAISESCTFRKI